jgi:hypothetical protein
MRNVKIILELLVIICASLFLEGCIVAAVGAGIAAVKYGNSKKTEAQAKNMDSYNQYEIGMQKINIERAQKNLPPVKIMTYKEYLNDKN